MSERLAGIVTENKERLLRLRFKGNLQTPVGSVNLYTDLDGLQIGYDGEPNVLAGMIPGWRVGKEPGVQPDSIFLLEDDEKLFLYDREAKAVFLFGSRGDFVDGQALGWISYWMMEAQRQQKSLFTLHSSALTVDKKGILLLGHSGAGKTSVMIDLCKKYNGEVASNDLTIVGYDGSSSQMNIIDGTKEIRLRLSSVEKNFPELREMFPAKEESAWESKIVVTPEQIGLRSLSEPILLHAIFEIHLDSKEKDPLLIRREDGIPMHYRLYEDMSRIVKGSAISAFSNDAEFLGYMPSLDSEEMHRNRVECINHMVKRMGVISVSGGNLDQISKTIFESLH